MDNQKNRRLPGFREPPWSNSLAACTARGRWRASPWPTPWALPRLLPAAVAGYCAGLMTCEKPIVSTSRNMGVRGGKSDGVRKFVSKL